MVPQKPRSKFASGTSRPKMVKTGPRSRAGKASGNPKQISKNPSPKKPRYWLRRLIALILLVLFILLVVLIGWMLWKGGEFAYHYFSTRDKGEVTRAVSPEDSVVDPVPCTPDMLKLTVLPSSPSLTEGTPLNLRGTLENTGKVPCYIKDGTGLASWVITSGKDTVTDYSTCSPSQGDRLLLPVDYKWNIDWKWDGNNHGADCKANVPAKPGNYMVKAKLMGKLSETGVAFQVVPAPPKEDDSQDANSSKDANANKTADSKKSDAQKDNKDNKDNKNGNEKPAKPGNG